MVRTLVIGLNEECGETLSSLLINKINCRKGLVEYLNGLLSLELTCAMIILGGTWRFNLISSLVGKNYDIELIFAHNLNWMQGTGTILTTVSRLMNEDFVFSYNILPSYNVLRKIIKYDDHICCVSKNYDYNIDLGFAYVNDDRILKIGNIVKYNAYLAGLFLFQKNIHHYIKLIDSYLVTYELHDFLYWFNRWSGLKPVYIDRGIIPLSKFDKCDSKVLFQ